MAKKNDIKVDITATDKTGTALTSAKNSIRRFSENARNLVANVAAPLAVVTSAIMILKKAFELVAEHINHAGKVLRATFAEGLTARMENLEKSLGKINDRFATMERSAKSASTILKAQATVARDVADANAELVKAGQLASAASSEQAQEIEAAYQKEQELQQAAYAVADAKQKQADLIAAANRQQEHSAALAKEEAKANKDAWMARNQALQYGQQSTSKWAIGSKISEEMQADAKNAMAAADNFSRKAADIAKQRQKLEEEAAENRKLANITADEIVAASRRQIAVQARQSAEDEIKRMDEIAEKKKEIAELEQKLVEKNAAAEDKAHREALAHNQEQVRAAQDKAKNTIQAFLDAQKAQEAEDKQEAKDVKRAEKLRKKEQHGVRLNRRDAEFLRAIEKREQALGGVKGAQAAAQAAQAALANAELAKQSQELKTINDSLKNHNAKLDKLLMMG